MKRFLLSVVRSLGWVFSWVVNQLPVRMQFFLGDILGWLWFDILRIRRQIVLDNLEIAYPEMTRSERTRVGRWSCRHLGRGLVEFCRFPFMSEPTSKKSFMVRGREHYEAARAKGHGVCFLSMHLGNGDLAAVGLAFHGINMSIITKYFAIDWVNDLWFGLRGRFGTQYIPPRNSSYAVLKALNRSENVTFVLDQFMGPPLGVKTQFFGKTTGSAMGLALLAGRAKAPVVPVYTLRQPDGSTIIQIEPEISYESQTDKDLTIRFMTQKYTDKIEEIIRRCPEQWMWVHRRWKPWKERQ